MNNDLYNFLKLQEENAIARYLANPPEEFYEEETDETLDYDKDSMGETIAQEDGVFKLIYQTPQMKYFEEDPIPFIATQNTIVDFYEQYGAENIKLEYLGLGEKYLKTGGKENE